MIPVVAAVVTISEQQASRAGAVDAGEVARTGDMTNSVANPDHVPRNATTAAGPLSGAQHEQVVFCNDLASGLRAIIALYSTQLGPGLGGTRFCPYGTDEAAISDVLNLSKAMAYKNALAGPDSGHLEGEKDHAVFRWRAADDGGAP